MCMLCECVLRACVLCVVCVHVYMLVCVPVCVVCVVRVCCVCACVLCVRACVVCACCVREAKVLQVRVLLHFGATRTCLIAQPAAQCGSPDEPPSRSTRICRGVGCVNVRGVTDSPAKLKTEKIFVLLGLCDGRKPQGLGVSFASLMKFQKTFEWVCSASLFVT